MYLSHGIEVHTDDVVKAEFGASITIPCSYTPRSSRSNFGQVLWRRGINTIIYVHRSDPDQDSTKVSDRYSLSVDFVSSGNLTINDVVIDDEGTYTCASNLSPADTFLFNQYFLYFVHPSLSVQPFTAPRELLLRGQAANNPVVIHQNAVTLKPGVDVEFECQAVRSRPAVTIKWYYAGALVEPLSSPSPSSDDVGFQNTTSSFAIARPSRTDHGESLVCQAVMMDGRVVRITSIIINVEEPPDQPIDIHGLAYTLTSSTRYKPYCIAGSSFPSSEITWSLDEENVTDDAEVTTTNMASGYVRVISELSYVTKREDYGKILRCKVSHVALREDVVAEKAICLIDTEMNLSSVEGDLSGSLFLEVSGIPHSASCSLSACDIAQDNSTTRDECIERYLGDTYSDFADHVHEFTDLVASTTYDVSLRCVHRLCGESTTETRATVPSTPDRGGKNIDSENMNSVFNAEPKSSTENVWLRDLIFVIIAVIVVSAFVIVVTVSIVLRAVVKRTIRAAGGQDSNHVTPNRVGDTTTSFSRSSSLSSALRYNLYTIEEGNEVDPKIYQEIKEFRSSLVNPSDIIVSIKPSEEERKSLRESMRSSMRHPRPPPLPPLTNRVPVDTAVVSDSTDTESDKEDYVPMSPDTYSIDSEYMVMSSIDTN
ncbi:uncharacterized protein LOC121419645 [Lytechinus variegatus]|uniref:uncharacterized protein LOC121419645 n=1 Tax=Lytechinus variegatus TaxID=7654 RepID=UPI001BB0FD31|nr:uncharacterized protein LOC121419645 [Lytechinus variegatus]